MSGQRLRFGFHDFLNAQPILIPLLDQGREAGLEIRVDVPSALAEQLKAGELDLAMIPAIEFLKEAKRYRLVPGVCIASRGVVKTVLLVARGPIEQIRSLAVDQRSRTSVALLKILFAKQLSPETVFHPLGPDLQKMLEGHDAALIIGDQALAVRKEPARVLYDLSEEWLRQTGRPMVHAVVAVRDGVTVKKETMDFIRRAGETGLGSVVEIARNYARRNGLDLQTCEDYLKRRIIYDLGKEEMKGLIRFRDLCLEQGLISQKFPVHFAEFNSAIS